MTHAETLAKAEDYRQGRLSGPQTKTYRDHLESCPACRELVKKWPEGLPQPGLTGRVMARLSRPLDVPASKRGWVFVPLTAGLVAVLLVMAAFWHPERKWLEEDKYFARFDHGRTTGMVQAEKEKFYE